MKSFGLRLRQTMNEQGLTDGMVASDLGQAKGTFNHWVNGRAQPRFETLVAISELLGTNLHWLLTGEGPKELPDTNCSLTSPIRPKASDVGRATPSEVVSPSSEAFTPPPVTTPIKRSRFLRLAKDIRDWVGDIIGAACLFATLWGMLWIGEILA